METVPEGFVLASLGSGFGEAFGPVFIDRSRRKMGFRVSERHVNPVGTCHGGALATFADIQLMAIRAGAEEGRPHSPTISVSVDFIAPIDLGAWVEADVALVGATRTMVFTQAVLSVGPNVVARTNAIYRNGEKQEAGYGQSTV